MADKRNARDVATRLAILAIRARETGASGIGARAALQVARSLNSGDMEGATRALHAMLGRGILKQLVDNDSISGVPASQVVEDAYRLVSGRAPSLRSPIIGLEAARAREVMSEPSAPTMKEVVEQLRDARRLILDEAQAAIAPHLGRIVALKPTPGVDAEEAVITGVMLNGDADRDPLTVCLATVPGMSLHFGLPAASIPEISGETTPPDRFYRDGRVVTEAEFRGADADGDTPEPA